MGWVMSEFKLTEWGGMKLYDMKSTQTTILHNRILFGDQGVERKRRRTPQHFSQRLINNNQLVLNRHGYRQIPASCRLVDTPSPKSC